MDDIETVKVSVIYSGTRVNGEFVADSLFSLAISEKDYQRILNEPTPTPRKTVPPFDTCTPPPMLTAITYLTHPPHRRPQ